MQAEADDADTQQQREQREAAAAAFSEPPLQHMLPGLLGHDAGALLEQKGAFFHRGGAAAGGDDFTFAAGGRRVTDLRARAAAAAPPAFAQQYGRQHGRSAYGTAVQQQDGGEDHVAQGRSFEHSWVRRRPALLQSAQQRQQQRKEQQRGALVAFGDEQQQREDSAAAARPVGAGTGSALLVRPLAPQDLQLQISKAVGLSGMQQQGRLAVITPLLPATAAISSSAAAVDAALMLGRSFRVGWGSNGQLVVPCNPHLSSSSTGAGQLQQQQQSPTVELRQLQPLAAVALPGSVSSSSSTAAGSAAAVTGMRQRVLSGLQLHLENSQPADAYHTGGADAPWELLCDRDQVSGYVSALLSAIEAAADAAATDSIDADSSSSSAADAAGCTDHLRQLWLLLQLLFEYIEGQDDYLELDNDTAAAGVNGVGDDDMGEGSEGELSAPKQHAVAEMQRKAALSKWLQVKLRPQVGMGWGLRGASHVSIVACVVAASSCATQGNQPYICSGRLSGLCSARAHEQLAVARAAGCNGALLISLQAFT